MEYGYFDKENREYVITNPKTPTPWMNYLGNGGYGGIISANAGGLSFDGDPSNRRVTRYRFQGVPMDRPGRYIYIRDTESGDYFTPSWQPVQREMQFYECRHGFGYTKITGKYMDILASTVYYVPEDKHFEIWETTLKNESEIPKTLKIYSYAEFSYPNAQYDDLCHWPAMLFKTYFDKNKLIIAPAYSKHKPVRMLDYIATDLEVIGYDTDINTFVGMYNTESNPDGVVKGVTYNTLAQANGSLGVLCSEITLLPGESKTFKHTMGATWEYEDIDTQIDDALNHSENALAKIKEKWDAKLDVLQIETPSDEMNLMINSWHGYQANTTFDWSRFISFYERGIDRGFGFRDSMQDVLGVMHCQPEKAKERIKLLLSIQKADGNAYSVYYPATKTAVGGGRSDDHLWSILSVCNYVRETGNTDFLFEEVPYRGGGSDTVLGHLEKGIEFTMNNLGQHGIPNFLLSDWDDSLSRINDEKKAESVFVFFQLAHGVNELRKLYLFLGNQEKAAEMEKLCDYCKSKLDIIWDGKWFIRAFTSKGEKFCTDDDEFNKIHLIPQSWAVMSGLVDRKKGNTAIDNVLKYLYTDMGLITHYNPTDDFDPQNKGFYPCAAGVKENGGIFFHSNTWAIIAMAMLSRGDDAFKCYFASLPCRRNENAEKWESEPYVYSQAMIAAPNASAGRCTNSWLTGTASWMYYAATQYILGIRPEYDGLKIDPQIPSGWDGFRVSRKSRGNVYNVTVKKGSDKGLFVNGERVDGDTVPWNISGTVEVVKNI